MEILGHIHNGVVILEGQPGLPEGTRVYVSVAPPAPQGEPQIERVPGQLPLVRGGIPGSVELTNERVHEILEEDFMTTILK